MPNHPGGRDGARMSEAMTPTVPHAREGMAWVPDGEFQMGSEAFYCLRFRPAARQGEAVDTSTGHIGFRCISRTA